ncbi:sporulation protein YabP [Pseudoflavonifractor sp. 60]|uniref:sporulation protein YabP n=1 Tax=Pseudoflavonifractor sp. 60 TaxID=2304576 RepID=UPI00136CE925|nr:sporulation protein YabP [Pseudoflavonifractor sp. 60]NBI65812.1 sporulation protein YabP [Pseudoflavonifractor sp. 60]
MAFVDDRARPTMSHHIILEEREQLVVSGVEEVESFDENTILLTTAQGGLEIQGEGLHIEKLSLDGGDLKVEGRVNALLYESDQGGRGGGFLARLLGG